MSAGSRKAPSAHRSSLITHHFRLVTFPIQTTRSAWEFGKASLANRREEMAKAIKYVEKGLAVTANALWHVFEPLNRIKPNPSFTPKWSDKPLLKSYQKTKPPLGWPRTTDSLCPKC